MEDYDVKRLALVFAIQAEIEGMKAENEICKVENGVPCYGQKHFNNKADDLKEIANRHDIPKFPENRICKYG